MSNKRDYTRYSKENTNLTETVEPVKVAEETVETVDHIVEVVEEPKISEQVIEESKVEEPVVEEPKPTSGIVTNCLKLNVRERPSVNADILGTINEGSEVIVNEDESTDEFYKVCTSAGLEGYCMRKFISIMP